MANEKFIKDGKFYNPETSKLIAISSVFMSYGYKRKKIMQTAKGAFFEIEEKFEVIPDGKGKLRLVDSYLSWLIPDNRLKEIYEHTVKGGEYATRAYGSEDTNYKYTFQKTYSELFEVEEG